MKEIALTQGKVAIVDDEDYEDLIRYKWYAHRKKGNYTFYARRTIPVAVAGVKGKKEYMHQHLLKVPDGMMVDHRNGNGLDNRRSNIRVCTNSQNLRNQKTTGRANKSGFKGVVWSKKSKKWQAQIAVNKEYHYLGLFFCIMEAARVYDEAAKKYHGEFARLNFNTTKDQLCI